MKFKLKITTTKLLKYTYLALIIANLFGLYFYYSFIDKYILQTINYNYQNKSELSSDIDMEKFDIILENIEKKTKGNSSSDIKNIFE